MDFEFQDEGFFAKKLKETGEKDIAVGNVNAIPDLLGTTAVNVN